MFSCFLQLKHQRDDSKLDGNVVMISAKCTSVAADNSYTAPISHGVSNPNHSGNYNACVIMQSVTMIKFTLERVFFAVSVMGLERPGVGHKSLSPLGCVICF